MKTIKEWLSELPEPYRTQALGNYDDTFYPSATKAEDAIEALEKAFNWERSPERWHYWKEARETIKTSMPLPAPTCALEALMAIALKKGFPVEDIESIEWLEADDGNTWRYRVKSTGEWHIINLKP